MAKTKKEESGYVSIRPPNTQQAKFKIIGTSPYVQLRFSMKAQNEMRAKMEGKTAKGRKNRENRDFDAEFLQSMYQSPDGWRGIPASSFRNAMISACRLVNFKMTLAKLSVFVSHDGVDKDEPTVQLVRIDGEPTQLISHVRNATGVADLRVRASFFPWSAEVCVTYDADQFKASDVGNLLSRVGMQVGIGEGRPDGKASAGMGWGLFKLEDGE